MYDLELLPYLSVPNRQPNPALQKVYDRAKSLSPMPITILSCLFDSEHEVGRFDSRMKVSRLERLVALFIVNHKTRDPQSLTSNFFQDILVDNKDFPPKGHPLFEFLKFQGYESLLQSLLDWKVPKFPISGHELKKYNVKPGKEAGRVLKLLREKWKSSRYLSTKDELLSCLPNLLNTSE